MVGRWFKRLFGSEDGDPDERRRIAAEHDRHRTGAIIAAKRMEAGHRLDSPIEPDQDTDRNRDRPRP